MREAVEEDHEEGHSLGSVERTGEKGDKKEQPGTDPNLMFAPMDCHARIGAKLDKPKPTTCYIDIYQHKPRL